MRKLVLILIMLIVFLGSVIYGGEYVSYLYSNFPKLQEESRRDWGFPEFLKEIDIQKIINERIGKIMEKEIEIGEKRYTLNIFYVKGENIRENIAAVYDEEGNFITDFETARLVVAYYEYYPYYKTIKEVLNEKNSEEINKILSQMEKAEITYTVANHIKSAIKGVAQAVTQNPKIVNTVIEAVSTHVGHILLKSSLEMYEDIVKEAEGIAKKPYKELTERELYFTYGFVYSIRDIAEYVSKVSKEVMGENSVFNFFKTLLQDINSILPTVAEEESVRTAIYSSELVENIMELTEGVEKEDNIKIAGSMAGIMLDTVKIILDTDIPIEENDVEKLILEEIKKINKTEMTLERILKILENRDIMKEFGEMITKKKLEELWEESSPTVNFAPYYLKYVIETYKEEKTKAQKTNEETNKNNQEPTIEWQKTLGGSGSDGAGSIQQTSDGGYVVAGYTESTDGDVSGNHGDKDYWVVKLDDKGNIEWQKCLGGSDDDLAESIQQTKDSGYIIAGYTYSNDGDVSGNHGYSDYWVVKLDKNGNIEWQKCLGGSDSEWAESIQQTSDGGYIVAGYTWSNDEDVSGHHGDFDYWIVKLNSNGNIEWQKCLGGSNFEWASSIQQTSDGGYIVAGWTKSYDGDITGSHGWEDIWVVKLDDKGNIEWQKCLGGSDDDETYSIQQTNDGGYIVIGDTESDDGVVSGNYGDKDYWIVKLDEKGNIEWQKCLGGSDSEWAESIQQTSDGGYIVAGGTWSNDGDVSGNHGGRDYWIVKLGWELPINKKINNEKNGRDSEGDFKVIFSDNFDSYDVGSFPYTGGWRIIYSGYGSKYQIVDNTEYVSPFNSLKLEGTTGWSAAAFYELPSLNSKEIAKLVYEVDVKAEQIGGTGWSGKSIASIRLYDPDKGTWGKGFAGIAFGSTEDQSIRLGGNKKPYELGKWYHVKCEIDFINKKITAWIDGELLGSVEFEEEDIVLRGISPTGDNDAHSRVYYDNLIIYIQDKN